MFYLEDSVNEAHHENDAQKNNILEIDPLQLLFVTCHKRDSVE